ncbi:MAG: 1-acyl-sn-glycerol-3-phosphate acyltransferase [Spirochaetales bacterium]
MKSNSLAGRYGHMFKDLERYAKAADKIDDTNVYQKANEKTRTLIDIMLKDHLLEGARAEGLQNFEAFYNALLEGKRGLLLVEHFSNMDLPALCYLLEHSNTSFGKDLADRIVAMAGMKLNEANPMVKAWAEAFTRIVIYPSRSLAAITDEAERAVEEAKSRKINMASMHALTECRKNGQAILVFPSGTRYRPSKPETRNGLREIDSYLRMFDVMLPVSINGNCLRIDPENPENMLADLLIEDTVLVAAGPVLQCKQFRSETMSEAPDTIEDKKQYVVDKVMNILKAQHDAYQPVYLEAYKKATGNDSDYTI